MESLSTTSDIPCYAADADQSLFGKIRQASPNWLW
jgi:hypothetical protein